MQRRPKKRIEKKRSYLIGIDMLLIGGAFVLCMVGLRSAQITINNVVYFDAQEIKMMETIHPVRFPSGTRQTEVTLNIAFNALHPLSLRFTPNDCLERLWINGEEVRSKALPYCHHQKGRTLFLGSFLQKGDNTVRAIIRNHGGNSGLTIDVPWHDPIVAILYSATLALAALFFLYVFRATGITTEKGVTKRTFFWLIIIGGILLRIFYLLVTEFLVRGHDVYGHIEYMDHIAQYWSIPATGDGWQFYHPPLYYIITGGWLAIGSFFGRARMMLIEDIQFLSFVVATATFLVGVWIGKSFLFVKNVQRRDLNIFIAILAVFPGFIFFAGRINNDVLVLLWMFLSFFYFLHWWKNVQTHHWILSILFLILGILTKSNAILLAPALFLCLLLHKKASWRRKGILGCIGILLIITLAGWHAVYRFGIEKNQSVVANITHLNRSLSVDNSFNSISTFNPFAVIKYPYNDPFSSAFRRDIFWEYLFKSSFFGEFHFGPQLQFLCAFILINALLLFPLILIGIWQSARKKFYESSPILFALFFPLLGHVLYRQTAPFSTSQDFRYSMFILIPLAYFLIVGLHIIPKPLQRIATSLIYIFIGCCVLFILSIRGP